MNLDEVIDIVSCNVVRLDSGDYEFIPLDAEKYAGWKLIIEPPPNIYELLEAAADVGAVAKIQVTRRIVLQTIHG